MLDYPPLVDPTFTVDRAGTYVAQLVGDDGNEASSPDTVVLTVEKSAPVADGPVDFRPGADLQLDGRDSDDADGDSLAYRWAVPGVGSEGDEEALALGDPGVVSPHLLWDDAKNALIPLVVNDGWSTSAPDMLFVSSGSNSTLTDGGEDPAVRPGREVTLSDVESADPDGDALDIRWTLLSTPKGSTSALSDLMTRRRSFMPDLPGTYVPRSIVSDSAAESLPDTVKVAVTEASTGGVFASRADSGSQSNAPSRDAPLQTAETTPASLRPLSSIATELGERATVTSETFTPPATGGPLPAFLGCEGSGCAATGGRGGRVIEVTNLSDRGRGSLRACLEASGARTCVFRTGGTIPLRSPLIITNPFLTIAGQTAPGGGILLDGRDIDGSGNNVITIRTHDVVIRYIRVRKGWSSYCYNNPDPGCGATLQLIGNHDIYNIVFDHNSTSWNTDEGLGLWRNFSNRLDTITWSWNLVGEPLDNHPTGMLTGAGSRALADGLIDVDIHHNMIVSADYRNPLYKSAGGRIINNIIYNFDLYAMQFGGGVVADIIGNIFKAGPVTGTRPHEIQSFPGGNSASPNGDPSFYVVGNIGPHHSDPELDNWPHLVREVSGENGFETGTLSTAYRRDMPLGPGSFPISISHVDDLEAMMLRIVGASRRLDCDGTWLPARDAVDTRMINEYVTRTATGWKISHEREVGGFPTIALGTPCADADHDGMPDTWEIANGLDPNDAADRNDDFNGDGYTNLEKFLNGPDTVDDGGTEPPPSTPLPTAHLLAEPPAVSAGELAVLRWSSTDATSCTGTNFSTGGAVSGSDDVVPPTDTTYSLDCTGPGGSASDTATVVVTTPEPEPEREPSPTPLEATNCSFPGAVAGRLRWEGRGSHGSANRPTTPHCR